MALSRTAAVTLISLSRIPLALAFVATLAPRPGNVLFCVAFTVAALITDVADGFFARRLGIATVRGRHWDSLGDKSFYMAVDVAFISNGVLLSTLGWALIAREIALYTTRILYLENLDRVEAIRPYTNWHGYFMYLLIVLGLAEMWGVSSGRSYGLFPYIQLAALGAIAFGVASVFAYIRLGPQVR